MNSNRSGLAPAIATCSLLLLFTLSVLPLGRGPAKLHLIAAVAGSAALVLAAVKGFTRPAAPVFRLLVVVFLWLAASRHSGTGDPSPNKKGAHPWHRWTAT